jgi:hypothetical protein
MTDVERQEEQFLAATDAKAQAESGQAPEPTGAAIQDAGDQVADMSRATEGRWGSGGVRIEDVTFTSNEGVATHVFHTGEPVRVRMKVHAEREIEDFVFGIGVFNAEGICIYGTNTDIEEFESASLTGDAEVTLVIEAMDLVEGTYKLDVAVHRRDGAPYDYHRLLYTFRVKSRLKDVGIYRPRHHWMFDGGVKFKNRI